MTAESWTLTNSTHTTSYVCTFLKVKVKVRTLDLAPLRESSPQKRSGMARVLKGSSGVNASLTLGGRPSLPFLPCSPPLPTLPPPLPPHLSP